jgi:hypothetical protein
MTLQNLIQSGNYDSPQAAYDAITSPSIEVRDDQLYTWGGVADLIGPEAAEKLRIKFDTSGLGWVSLQLGGLGLPLTDSRVRLALTGFMQMGVEGCDVLLNKGITTISLAQQANIQQPTLEQVTTEWNAWKAETDLALLRESLRIRFDAILNQVGTSEQSQAVAELRLIANELEA